MPIFINSFSSVFEVNKMSMIIAVAPFKNKTFISGGPISIDSFHWHFLHLTNFHFENNLLFLSANFLIFLQPKISFGFWVILDFLCFRESSKTTIVSFLPPNSTISQIDKSGNKRKRYFLILFNTLLCLSDLSLLNLFHALFLCSFISFLLNLSIVWAL